MKNELIVFSKTHQFYKNIIFSLSCVYLVLILA